MINDQILKLEILKYLHSVYKKNQHVFLSNSEVVEQSGLRKEDVDWLGHYLIDKKLVNLSSNDKGQWLIQINPSGIDELLNLESKDTVVINSEKYTHKKTKKNMD